MDLTRQRLLYILFDYLMAAVGWAVFNILRYYTLPPELWTASLSDFLCSSPLVLGQILIPIGMVLLYALAGSYNRRNTLYRSRLDEVLTSAWVSLAGMIGIYFVVLINDNIPERITNYELALMMWLCLFIPTAVCRMIEVTKAARATRRGNLVMPTLVIGANSGNARRIKRLQVSSRYTGLRITACMTDDPDMSSILGPDVEIYAPDSDIAELCQRTGTRAVILLPSKADLTDTVKAINTVFPLDIPIFISPDLMSLIAFRPHVSSVIGEPLIDISRANISPFALNSKRLSDIIVSSCTLLLLSPLFAALAVAVRLDSPGPALYRQRRVGLHKKPFTIYKFRTMRVDAEPNGPELTGESDPRVTRLGRFLRKYRLDELPQFWNVLRGDMSLVGPRPEREYFIRQLVAYQPAYTLVHQMRPGITSWGMVKYGYASDISQMLERLPYDLLYIENVSLGVDLKILFHTVSTVLGGRGQ